MNILIDAKEYNKEAFEKSFDFLFEHGLIEVVDYLKRYKVNFVGEVITPFNHIVSLPKNFNNSTAANTKMVIDILKEYKNLKKDGRILIKNKSYVLGNEIDSRLFYWRKLYTYFIDYITYEFYYPQKRAVTHSIQKLKGVINPLLTELNRDKKGLGLTYESKNIFADSYFRNVYYSALKQLQSEFGTETEILKVREMEVLLTSMGYKFEEITVDAVEVVTKLKSERHNVVHEPISKTLLKFYQDSMIKEQYTINVFYTKEFEYVCEYLIQTAFGHNLSYKPIDWINPQFKELNPDIFTREFVGDVKYYVISQLSERSFDKELYAHNVATNCSTPNLILIPGEQTAKIKFQIHRGYKLLIVSLNLPEVFNDNLNKTKAAFTSVLSILKENWN